MVDMPALPIDRDPGGDLGRAAEAVHENNQRITVTRGGRPLAVMVSAEEWWSIRETMDILTTPGSAEALDEGVAELDAGHDTDGGAFLAAFRAHTGEPREGPGPEDGNG